MISDEYNLKCLEDSDDQSTIIETDGLDHPGDAADGSHPGPRAAGMDESAGRGGFWGHPHSWMVDFMENSMYG